MDKKEDKAEDIHFPHSFSPFIKMEDDLTLIFPAEAPAMRKVNMDTVVRVMIISDDDFGEIGEGLEPERCTILGKYYYKVKYIRFNRLRDVSDKEWYYSTYNGQVSFSKNWKKDPNAIVRVIKLDKEVLSLKELNQFYKTKEGSNKK